MHKPIRALYLQPAAHFGGAERQAATIVPLLPEFGVETVPLVGPGDEIVRWLRERGVEDHMLSDAYPGGWPKLAGVRKLALVHRYVRCVRRFRSELARIARERDIDIVLAAMAFSWFAATPVARALGIPIVWRAGGTECTRIERMLLSAWARWHRPDWLVCNGNAVERLYGPVVGAPSTVIRNGLDPRQFHPGAAAPLLRPTNARLVVGFAGRLVPQKRPEDFIALAARFAARDDVAFLLAGDGSRREHYAELARRMGARTLQVVGYQRDMRAFHASCDVVVLPSRSEGCPNVVLEAMAMGSVVIAANAPATCEIVSDGIEGLLYPIGDIDAMHARLQYVIDEPERQRLLVAGARRRVRQLSAHDCAARTAALLRAISAHRSTRRHPEQAPDMELQASRST